MAQPTLDWLVNDKKIAPHIPVIDMAQENANGIFSREDFTYDKVPDVYTCPGWGELLTTTGRIAKMTCVRTEPANSIAISAH